MMVEGLKFFTETYLTVIALVLFVVTFAAASVWTMMRKDSKQFYQKVANLALAEDQHE
jgi:hypothetical protein